MKCVLKITSLLNLAVNETAKVIRIDGGHGIAKRLESLGLRQGVHVKKINSSVLGGPIVIRVGRTNMAIGKGISRKIVVEAKK